MPPPALSRSALSPAPPPPLPWGFSGGDVSPCPAPWPRSCSLSPARWQGLALEERHEAPPAAVSPLPEVEDAGDAGGAAAERGAAEEGAASTAGAAAGAGAESSPSDEPPGVSAGVDSEEVRGLRALSVQLVRRCDEGIVSGRVPRDFAEEHVAALFRKYAGLEHELYVRLCRKYGEEPPLSRAEPRQESGTGAQAVRDFLVAEGFASASAGPGALDVNASRRSLLARPTRPLHVAVRRCDARVVEQLLAARADPRLRSASGRTPLELARKLDNQGSHSEVAAILRRAANVDAAL